MKQKVGVKNYLLQFLATIGSPTDELAKMIILLLARITKLAWFDNPEMQNIVTDL